MAKLIEQINNLKIKKYTTSDPYYHGLPDAKRYLVQAPDGRILEDRLTLSQARAWSQKTLDFTTQKPSTTRALNILEKNKGRILQSKHPKDTAGLILALEYNYDAQTAKQKAKEWCKNKGIKR